MRKKSLKVTLEVLQDAMMLEDINIVDVRNFDIARGTVEFILQADHFEETKEGAYPDNYIYPEDKIDELLRR